jgi:DNA mismatch repair ATPase MutS
VGAEFWEALANLDIRTVIIGVLLLMLFSCGTAFFRAMLKGKLVSRLQHEDIIKERDLWRQAHQESEHTRQAVADMLDKVIDQSTLTNELLKQLKSGGRR